MDWQNQSAADAVVQILSPDEKDMGDFTVRRLLPAPNRRSVGPFVFFDHMGPVQFATGKGIDVRPHPHIGLATVTWLFEGEIMHRDSLGYVQPVKPGALNIMTAGRGIVHSERTSLDNRTAGTHLHGLQLWLGLPLAYQQTDPAFEHYSAGKIPSKEEAGVQISVIIGKAFGLTSPARVFSGTNYIEMLFHDAGEIVLPEDIEEAALYVVEGSAHLDGRLLDRYQMAILHPNNGGTLRCDGPARVILIGGEPLGYKPIIWWNLAASRPELIEKAKQDWKEGCFPPVPGETEFIPLPD